MSINAMKAVLDFLEQGNFVYPAKIADDLRAAITEAEKQEPEQHFRYKFLDRAALDAWIATNAAPQPAIPTGYALVPVEPTPTQIRSGQLGVTTTCAVAIYKAMVGSAPTQEDV